MGLEKLLYLRGVGADFTDCFGQYICIPEADRQGILTCMLQEKNTQACEAKDEPLTSFTSGDELDAPVYQLDAPHWTQVLPAFHWCYVDEPLGLSVFTSILPVAICCSPLPVSKGRGLSSRCRFRH